MRPSTFPEEALAELGGTGDCVVALASWLSPQLGWSDVNSGYVSLNLARAACFLIR